MQMRYKKAVNTPQGNLQLPQALGNAAAGIDQVILHMQMGGVPHEDIVRSIEVMRNELISRFA